VIVVISRFRVANGMEAKVERAFRERPRAVENAPGFLWLEVCVDRADPAVFYLITRWSDLDAFERWHGSPDHRKSHELIPKGLKLDATWTQLDRTVRIDGTTGPPLTEAVADAAILLGAYAAGSTEMHLLVLERDGVIRACNPAACHHLEPGGTLEGKSLLDYMPEPDATRLKGLLADERRTESPVSLNFAALNRVPFTLECWIDVQPDRATVLGEPTFRRDQQMQNELMAINQELAVLSRERSRELRDERYEREAAEKLNRERNAFLRILAHELRQPIGSALAAMGVLRKLNPDSALERPRALLERQLQQITRLVDDLADTARLASGDIELRREALDLTRQLQDIAQTWGAIAEQQRKKFRVELPDTTMLLRGDADRLQQVFSNVLGNAFKYTPPGATITLAATAEGNTGVINVADEGEGIPADRLPDIFELFQRGTNTSSGLGVGLAVVKALVMAHDGTVTATSAGLGRGTTIAIRLPLISKSELRPRAVPEI
jgi:signal transduction histidine kinase/heme-degrading monooxygenase HmoA